mmetsp:Transcript_17090/g.21940  ORF Transcript_17090/g.21940 Transcript_17090/m.21940 type:complete len:82 (+) Transcript_17090:1548-1793(+)
MTKLRGAVDQQSGHVGTQELEAVPEQDPIPQMNCAPQKLAELPAVNRGPQKAVGGAVVLVTHGEPRSLARATEGVPLRGPP